MKLRRLLIREILAWSRLAVGPACVVSLCLLFDRSYYLTDLISHFRLQYLLAGVVGLIVFGLARERIFLVASLVTLAVNLPPVYPYLSVAPTVAQASSSQDRLRLLMTNVRTENASYDSVLNLLRKKTPDIVVILEVNSEWEERIKNGLEGYPYSEFYPRPDNFGIALLSRFEFSINESPLKPHYFVPHIDASMRVGESSLRLLGIHAIPPVDLIQFRDRNILIRDTANLARDVEGALIVAGDFNASMWSSIYEEFLTRSELLDPREGRGVFPTWPAHLGIALIPIDHIFHTADLKPLKFESLNVPGSDHRGLLIDFEFPNAPR